MVGAVFVYLIFFKYPKTYEKDAKHKIQEKRKSHNMNKVTMKRIKKDKVQLRDNLFVIFSLFYQNYKSPIYLCFRQI